MHIFVLNLEVMVNNIIILYLKNNFKRNFSKEIIFIVYKIANIFFGVKITILSKW